ncbi:phosphoglycerate mutase family protein [Rossellomorea sp. GAMAL-10_SWC]
MGILFIRHGQYETDLLNVHERRADISLTDLGVKQVNKKSEKVKNEFSQEAIWTNTLKRVKENFNNTDGSI